LIGRLERLLPRECVVEGTEFVQSAFRLRDELHSQPILRFSASDLVTAILAEPRDDRVFRVGEIGDQREERGGLGVRDRSFSLAIQADIHAAIPRRLLVVPYFSVKRAASANADHSSALHY